MSVLHMVVIIRLFAAVAADITPAQLRANCIQRQRPLDIVISHFHEDLLLLNASIAQILSHPNVASRQPCVLLYTKSANPQDVSDKVPTAQVRWLPNVGREAHSYLHYMMQQYGEFADHTLFLQGSIESKETLLKKLDVLDHNTGFMCMTYHGRIGCDGSGEYATGDRRLREVWVLTRREFCFGEFQFCYRGQFLVSKHRLMGQPLEVYQQLFKYLGLPEEHDIFKDCTRPGVNCSYRKKHTPNDPLLGYTMERAWSFMFNCHSMSNSDATQLTSGSHGCQCFEGNNTCSPEEIKGACQCVNHLNPVHHS